MNILAIGAHHDDIELGCGGLWLKAVKVLNKDITYGCTRGEATGTLSTLSDHCLQSVYLEAISVKALKQQYSLL